MENRKLFERAKTLKLISTGSVEGLFAGNYRSAFKGPGIEFDEVREYTQNDDARFIDWNVSSRLGIPYLKTFKEERELVLFLIIDVSASLRTGAGSASKKETVGILSALLAFAAVYNNDRAGALFFSDRIEKVVPPRKGKKQVLRLVQDITKFEPRGTGSDLSLALKTANESLKRRGICIIISDFRTSTGLKELSLLSRKHDVIALRITDPLDKEYPPSGLFELKDPETGKVIYGQGYSKRYREDYHFYWKAQEQLWTSTYKKRGVEPFLVNTEDDPVQKLVQLFLKKKGEKGMRSLGKICLFLILLSSLSTLQAQSAGYKINSLMFLPPQFYVGDTVELRIHFTVSEEKELALPAVMPELSWITIKGMELQKVRGFHELRVVFSSFQPGTRAFPSLNLGGVIIEGIRIHTTSVLQEGERPFVQAFNPVNLPGTRLLLGFGSALLLFGPLILVIFGGKTLRLLREKLQLKQRRRPYRRFLKRMAELGNRMNKIERDEFYTILAREFRTYISQRLKRNFIPETTRETKKLLYREFPSAGFLEPLFSILEYGDRIRFGDRVTKRERKDPDLSTYKKTVEQIEEAIHRREQALRLKRKKKGVVYVGS